MQVFRNQKLHNVISTLSGTAFTALALPSAVFAQGEWTGGCVYDAGEFEVATIQGFECLLTNILATATSFIGLAAFVMIVLSAFLYMTSGNNTKGVEAAKQTLTYAVIGIVVALMAFFVLQVISDFTGVTTFLEFNLNIGN